MAERLPLPDGHRYLEKGEEVISGDLWHHNGEFMPSKIWHRVKHLGPQFEYNTYCRKIT